MEISLLGEIINTLTLLIEPVDLIERDKQAQQQLIHRIVLLSAVRVVQELGGAVDPNQIPNTAGTTATQIIVHVLAAAVETFVSAVSSNDL